LVIRIRRQIDNGDPMLLAQAPAGFDPIHGPLQDNIHQDQIGVERLCLFQRLRTGRRDRGNYVSQAVQLQLDAPGDNPFVLYDQDVSARHSYNLSVYAQYTESNLARITKSVSTWSKASGRRSSTHS